MLKPGPMASSRPRRPGGGGRCASVSRSTCSTEEDDRLPTSASERQVSSRARAGRSSTSPDRVQHLGAAGMADPGGDVLALEVVVGEETAHVRAEVVATRSGTSAPSTMRKPVSPMSQPITRSVPG